MAVQLGGTSGRRPAPTINVTPLVDVVLVLLIIFMVVTPLLDRKFWVHTPKQEKTAVQQLEQSDTPLVLRIGADGSLEINGTVLRRDELGERLPRMFAARDDHVLFIAAADSVPYGTVVETMDAAREAGAVTIAPLTQPFGGDGS
ncbi:MAG: biopolymer transporter ExbD [Candidatus Binatia bacterium]|nr:biopolymer transporter ExbD [Candidatus Binatia bacterium]